MKRSTVRLRAAVAALVILSAVPCSASIFTMTSFDDATIVWDGTQDVKTSNNSVSPTKTDIYANLGIAHPARLVISFDFRGERPDLPDPSMAISNVLLVLSVSPELCTAEDCRSVRQVLTEKSGLRLPDRFGSTQEPDLDSPVIPFHAWMQGTPVTASYHDRVFFRLSAGDQSRLRDVLSRYGAQNLHVGLAADTKFDGLGSIYGNPTFQVTASGVGSAVSDASTADYDGDGKTDLGVWRAATGTWYMTRSVDGTATTRQWGAAAYADVPVPGDYDGDGKTDVAVWRSSTGVWYVSRSSDGTVLIQQWGAGYAPYADVPVPGDYDGDGKTDLAVWRSSTGVWYVIRSSDGAPIVRQWGVGYAPYNDVPVPGDYDGDGKTDVAVWRSSTGVWYVSRSSDGTVLVRQWGVGYAPYNDVPVPGDYDRDGKTDVAVWRSSTGAWYVSRSSDGTVLVQQWGAGYAPYEDVPVPGDYDGDGKLDFAVWRPSIGVWFVMRSSNGSAFAQQWGAGYAPHNDVPVAGRLLSALRR
jgi:FG-GAP-like repeat